MIQSLGSTVLQLSLANFLVLAQIYHQADFYPNWHFVNNSHSWRYKIHEKNYYFYYWLE